MPLEAGPARPDQRALLSIGAVSRATGIPRETLRTWESRYGFPTPVRKPSGHRVYPSSCIERLRRISDALARGHRAAEVLTADDDQISLLLGREGFPPSSPEHPEASAARVATLLAAVRNLEAETLTRLLRDDWSRLGPLTFLERRVAPLIDAVGDGWANRILEIRHEHFASERLSDLLRGLREPFDDRATGPFVVVATLPGEEHGLGVQMAALVMATTGLRVRVAGTDLPVAQTATLARDLDATGVAISVSLSGRRGARRSLGALRSRLPRGTRLLVGGRGAPRIVEGAEILPSLTALDARARRLA